MEILLILLVLFGGVIICLLFELKRRNDYDNFFKITGHPNPGFRPAVDNSRKHQLLQDTSNIKLIGVFQSYTHPENADSGCKSDYCTQVRIKGDFGNKALYNEVFYKCPKCKKLHHIIYEHGDAYQCKCGLKTQSFGNGIYFWK